MTSVCALVIMQTANFVSAAQRDYISDASLQALARYGALCRLLLRLRRVSAGLDAAWSAMRAGGRAARGASVPHDVKV